MTSDDLQKVRALIAYVQYKDDCDKWEWIPHPKTPAEEGE